MRSRSGGDLERNHGEAKEEILPEEAAADLGGQVLVRCGQDPRVRGDRPRSADAREPPFLQGAQDLGLRSRGHVADLVEEKRAAVGLLEFPAAVLGGAGEGSAHVPEELRLDQLFRDRGAVDFDQGRVGPRGEPVEARGRRAPCRFRSRR